MRYADDRTGPRDVGGPSIEAIRPEDLGEELSPDGRTTAAPNDGRLVGAPALLLAVLEDAIHCAGLDAPGPRTEKRRLRDRARAWIRCREQGWLFSFESICVALAIDAERLRRRILQQPPVAPSARRRRLHGLPRPARRLERRAS